MKSSFFKSAIVLSFALSSHLFSQGAYLEKGKNGLGIAGVFSSNKDASAVGGSAGYSASGIFDFGISVAKISFGQKFVEKDLSATAISPFVTIHAIKQDETTPISVSISGSYESDSYSSDALSQLRWTLSASGYSFGASIYGNITTSPTMKLQPSVGVAYANSKSELKDDYGNSLTNESNATLFSVAVALLFQTTPTTIFGILCSIIKSQQGGVFPK